MNNKKITNLAIGAIVVSTLLFFVATALKSLGYLSAIPWWGVMIPLILPYLVGIVIVIISMIAIVIYNSTRGDKKKAD